MTTPASPGGEQQVSVYGTSAMQDIKPAMRQYEDHPAILSLGTAFDNIVADHHAVNRGFLAREMAVRLGWALPPSYDASKILLDATVSLSPGRDFVTALQIAGGMTACRKPGDPDLDDDTTAYPAVEPADIENGRAILSLSLRSDRPLEIAKRLAEENPTIHAALLARLMSETTTKREQRYLGAGWLAGVRNGGPHPPKDPWEYDGPCPEPGPSPIHPILIEH